MKNVVFIVDTTLKGSQRDVGRWAETRSDPYVFCTKAWKKWCDKNDCELFVLNEEVLPHSEMPVSWQRYYVFDLLEANGIDYDQVMYVDADTIPHPDCPNVFEMSDRKFCFVHNEGSYDWILRSIENYSKYFFDGYMIPWTDYFDSGMLIFNKEHKQFFQEILNFFHSNRENLLQVESKWHAGTDQTPVNYLVRQEKYPITHLSKKWNFTQLHQRGVLHGALFLDCAWMYHFNGFEKTLRNNLMKQTWEEMKRRYNLED